jgi:hypothetical protein
VASNPGQIPAGGKDKISVVVTTAGRGGQSLVKHFKVHTNDPRQPQVDLVVKGKIAGYATITPKRVVLVGRLGEPVSSQVRIIPQEGYPFTIKAAKAATGSNIQVALKPLGDKPAKDGYLLTVTSISETVGSYGDYIELSTDLKEKPTIGIPVSGRLSARRTEENREKH